MTKIRYPILYFSVLGILFLPSLAGSQTTEISGFSPDTAKPGDQVKVDGTGLTNQVKLVPSRGSTIDVSESASASGVLVTFTVPDDTADGDYGIRIVGQDGTIAIANGYLAISKSPKNNISGATPGWNGSIAFNPDNNTWLVVSQYGDGDTVSISGIILDNNGNPLAPAFKIDESGFFAGSPRAVYAPDTGKYLVVWVQELTAQGGSADINGRFIGLAGEFLGPIFNITPDIDGVPYINQPSLLRYDSKNQKFVLAWEHRGGIDVYLKTIGLSGNVGPLIKVTENPNLFLGSPSVAVNEKDNEYCVSYQWSDSAAENTGSSIGIKKVDASSGAVGPETFATNDAFFNNGIVYNSVEDEYLAMWQPFNLEKGTVARILNSCDGTDGGQVFTVSSATGAGNVSYNPKSNTYGVVGQDRNSFANNFIEMDGSGNPVSSEQVFPDAGIGNFAPAIAANTNNGKYAVTSSQDYSLTRFMSDLGSGSGRSAKGFLPFSIPGAQNEGLPSDLGALIETIFTWSLNIIGIIIFARIFYAGVKRLLARGNPGVISETYQMMTNAVLGAIILFAAYLILYTINPDLVSGTFNLPGGE